ncbi:MAG: GNAT family N-acetyltransferase [Planctomycetaceae bacterium]|nr:GNAT family N-acetyltransferase [Planctomycetaceae bacterium]
MPFRYVKRYQMVIDLRKKLLPTVQLPPGFDFLPWHKNLLERHAKVKYLSFCREMDARIFPTFRQYSSCLRLMTSISARNGFLPETTFLIVRGEIGTEIKDCATIQGIQHTETFGAIQNVAVLPEFRRRGLGQALVLRSLQGFLEAGLSQVSLEVTAANLVAIRLYERVGFETVKTVYKETISGDDD